MQQNTTSSVTQIAPLRLEVERLNKLINERAAKKEQDRQQYFRNLPISIRLNKGAKKMIGYAYPSTVSGMVERYWQYLESDGEAKAIEAAMLWGAEEDKVYNKSKIAKAIKIVLTYKPWLKTAVLRFNRDHPNLTPMLFSSSAVIVMFLVGFVLASFKAGVFGTIYFSIISVGVYMWYTICFLLKEPK